MKLILTILAASPFLLACSTGGTGDPVRGAKLHEDCLGCHGTEVYQPPRATVTSLRQLKKEVERWSDRMNPKFSDQEVDDIVAYLNQTYYKLP